VELKLDQALQKGVEAHKAGKVQEADRYYTAILKANPNHPDANHNMGVLAVGIGKVETALPFFKTALDTNPNIDQFWISYIDALIKLDRLDEAKAVFDQAKNKGAKGNGFDEIEKQLGSSTSNNSNNQEPSQAELQNLVNLYSKGQVKQVLTEASELLLKFPSSVDLYNITGAANQGLSKLEEAIQAYNKALSIDPDNATACNNKGSALKEQGKLEEAIDAYNKAIFIKPDYAEAHNNMGNALQEQGKLEQAIDAYNKAIFIKPDYAEAYNNMGIALKEQGKLEEAIDAYNNAIFIKPDYADACYNMGNALQEQGKLEEAIEAFNKAISIKADYAEAYYNMGIALKEQGKLEEAIDAYNKAIFIKPDYAEAYNNMGNALQEQGKLEEAIDAYNKAIFIKPDYAEAYNNMGNALQEQGKLEEAIDAYNKAIFIKPDYAEAYRNLSSIKKYNSDDKQFFQVKELYCQKGLNEDTRCHLSFALAKMYEDIGELDQNFTYLSSGNAMRKQLLNYSIDQDKNLFSKLKNAQPYLLKTLLDVKAGSIETIPIFILGMPRSGTTLVEQIISSHSEVLGAGELTHLFQLGLNLSADPTAINTAALSKLRNKYLSELSKLSDGKSIVTDKMPQNFLFIPLICAAFPEAKIIHVKRNAAATCWSNFKQYFPKNGLGYCYDLKDVVDYYKLYNDLTEFWQSQYGDRIYNLNYENLTTDQENQTRKLIKHIGLSWEEACLSPDKNKRSVKTASQQQVRQKVYKGSSEAWRKYEPYLNGAFDSLPSS
jgi:tetratricopeptide (TPR) repeat protein